MKDFCVVGSGISGCTIANLLSKKYTVEIFDKAKGLGGRASNRRYKNNINFDHGLQYISPEDDKYKNFILKLKKKRVLKKWESNHIDFNFSKNAKNSKYIGSKNNNDICKYLVKNLKVRYLSAVTSIKFQKNCWEVNINKNEKFYFKNLIITCPFPQLKILAKDYLDQNILKLKVKMEPNLTVMAVFKKYKKLPIGSIKFNDHILGFASNENSKKRFRTNLNLWTIQSNHEWAKKKINTYKNNKTKISNEILRRFEKLIGIRRKNLTSSSIHGWKYSYNFKKTKFKSYWIKKYNLGMCADWFLGSKAEHAWLSSNDLFNKLKKNPPISRRV